MCVCKCVAFRKSSRTAVASSAHTVNKEVLQTALYTDLMWFQTCTDVCVCRFQVDDCGDQEVKQ